MKKRERDEFMWFDIKCVCLVYGRLFAQHKNKKKKTKNVVQYQKAESQIFGIEIR